MLFFCVAQMLRIGRFDIVLSLGSHLLSSIAQKTVLETGLVLLHGVFYWQEKELSKTQKSPKHANCKMYVVNPC